MARKRRKNRIHTRDMVAIGQRWSRHPDGLTMTIRQIHRTDRVVQMVDKDGKRLTIHFIDLRRWWRQL